MDSSCIDRQHDTDAAGLESDKKTTLMHETIATAIPWYHRSIGRNIAEAILLSNGQEGSYLLRDSEHSKGEYALSTRCSDSVKHYEIKIINGFLSFGSALFETIDEFLTHFKNLPVIGSDPGMSLTLKYPYPNYVPEPPQYVDIKCHAICGDVKLSADSDCHIASREGYLTKLGGIHKSWRRRWFVLYKFDLKYYKRRGVAAPIRILDLKDAVEVTEDASMGKHFCFRLVFPERTFYMVASSDEEMRDWMTLIDWKLDYCKEISPT